MPWATHVGLMSERDDFGRIVAESGKARQGVTTESWFHVIGEGTRWCSNATICPRSHSSWDIKHVGGDFGSSNLDPGFYSLVFSPIYSAESEMGPALGGTSSRPGDSLFKEVERAMLVHVFFS